MKYYRHIKALLSTVESIAISAAAVAVIWFIWQLLPLLVSFD